MSRVKYSEEILSYIDNNKEKGYVWILDNLKSVHNFDTTYIGLRTTARRHGIKINNFKNGWNGYIVDFIKENYDKYTFEEMLDLIKIQFGKELSLHSLYHYYSRNKLKAIKKQLPIGSESVFYSNKVPVLYIKVSNDKDYKNNWIKKDYYIWKQHYGEVPKGKSIIHLDRDYRNCDISNLRLVSKSIVPKITHFYGYGIITEAMIEILKLEEEMKVLE